ncbi:hypothetical protein HK097_011680 [Rhizophlyctis rosea]|uniref:C2H2-type domain-containing protein n=1 Tax=Rhizophlyctis rosea TaxID=64517 RepID=A0AAD5WZR4_9FUNG|nr:hypothetical protein HK097_011680 [Rhizophlyctis rosea]
MGQRKQKAAKKAAKKEKMAAETAAAIALKEKMANRKPAPTLPFEILQKIFLLVCHLHGNPMAMQPLMAPEFAGWAQAAIPMFYERMLICCPFKIRKLTKMLKNDKKPHFLPYHDYFKWITVRMGVDDSLDRCYTDRHKTAAFDRCMEWLWNALADLLEVTTKVQSVGIATFSILPGYFGVHDIFPAADALVKIVKNTGVEGLRHFDISFADGALEKEGIYASTGPALHEYLRKDEKYWAKLKDGFTSMKSLSLIFPETNKVLNESDLYYNFFKAMPDTLIDLAINEPSIPVFRKMCAIMPRSLNPIHTCVADMPAFRDLAQRASNLKELDFDASLLLKQPPMRNGYAELANWFVGANRKTLENIAIKLTGRRCWSVLILLNSRLIVLAVLCPNTVEQQIMRTPPNPRTPVTMEGLYRAVCKNLDYCSVTSPRGRHIPGIGEVLVTPQGTFVRTDAWTNTDFEDLEIAGIIHYPLIAAAMNDSDNDDEEDHSEDDDDEDWESDEDGSGIYDSEEDDEEEYSEDDDDDSGNDDMDEFDVERAMAFIAMMSQRAETAAASRNQGNALSTPGMKSQKPQGQGNVEFGERTYRPHDVQHIYFPVEIYGPGAGPRPHGGVAAQAGPSRSIALAAPPSRSPSASAASWSRSPSASASPSSSASAPSSSAPSPGQDPVTKIVSKDLYQIDSKGRYRCLHCQKLFQNEGFVKNHITGKHPELCEDAPGPTPAPASSSASAASGWKSVSGKLYLVDGTGKSRCSLCSEVFIGDVKNVETHIIFKHAEHINFANALFGKPSPSEASTTKPTSAASARTPASAAPTATAKLYQVVSPTCVRCTTCQRAFASEELIKKHLQKRHPELVQVEDKEVEELSKKVGDLGGVNAELVLDLGDDKWRCRTCRKKFAGWENVKKHVRSQHSELVEGVWPGQGRSGIVEVE